MTTFTINEENEIVVFGSAEEAAATTATPFDSFTSQQEFGELTASWPKGRLVAIWNSLTGVTPVTKFRDGKTAVKRIRPTARNTAAVHSYIRGRVGKGVGAAPRNGPLYHNGYRSRHGAVLQHHPQ